MYMTCGIYQIVCFRDFVVTKENIYSILETRKKHGRLFKKLDEMKVHTYVGSSRHIERRWNEHKVQLRLKKHYNAKLQNSYNMYGIKSFAFIILEQCQRENLLAIEQLYIDVLYPSLNIQRIVGAYPKKEPAEIKRRIIIDLE